MISVGCSTGTSDAAAASRDRESPSRARSTRSVLGPAGSVSGDVVDRLGAPVFDAEVAVGDTPAWRGIDPDRSPRPLHDSRRRARRAPPLGPAPRGRRRRRAGCPCACTRSRRALGSCCASRPAQARRERRAASRAAHVGIGGRGQPQRERGGLGLGEHRRRAARARSTGCGPRAPHAGRRPAPGSRRGSP